MRQHRHELFDEEFQAELAVVRRPAQGAPPVPPAQLALATTLQVVEATLMDRRWQLARVRGHGVAGGVGLQPAVGRGPGRGHLYSLMGHALRKALGVLAAGQGQGLADGVADLAGKAGTPMPAASSLKAALDLDWDDPAARDGALFEVLAALDAVEAFVAAQPDPTGAVL